MTQHSSPFVRLVRVVNILDSVDKVTDLYRYRITRGQEPCAFFIEFLLLAVPILSHVTPMIVGSYVGIDRQSGLGLVEQDLN